MEFDIKKEIEFKETFIMRDLFLEAISSCQRRGTMAKASSGKMGLTITRSSDGNKPSVTLLQRLSIRFQFWLSNIGEESHFLLPGLHFFLQMED